MYDLNELERLARATYPGPWLASQYLDTDEVGVLAQDNAIVVGLASRISHGTAQYIAAANPATLLTLIQRLQDAERERDQAVLERDTLLRHGVPRAGRGW